VQRVGEARRAVVLGGFGRPRRRAALQGAARPARTRARCARGGEKWLERESGGVGRGRKAEKTVRESVTSGKWYIVGKVSKTDR
jgi:hypothetical protein